MGKHTEPRVCLLATCNEAIALQVAILRHLNLFADDENQETNQLLRQFQTRLVERLDALSLPHPPVQQRGSPHG